VFYWLLKGIILGPILRAVFRPWIRGEENIPVEGAAILASNHLSFSDSIFLPLMVRRRVTFLAKMDYFTGRGFKGAKAGFFRASVSFPDRSGGSTRGGSGDWVAVARQGDLLDLPGGHAITRRPVTDKTGSPEWLSPGSR
jgi:1-acyl-sn-glycerol-3-phosphate acyltransferase